MKENKQQYSTPQWVIKYFKSADIYRATSEMNMLGKYLQKQYERNKDNGKGNDRR